MTNHAYQLVRQKRVNKVLKFIGTVPHTTKEIACVIGVSESTAGLLLREMEAEGQIHRVRQGPASCWLAGPDPDTAIEERTAAYLPKREVRKTWPMHNFRSEFDTFLFGPAGEVAA